MEECTSHDKDSLESVDKPGTLDSVSSEHLPQTNAPLQSKPTSHPPSPQHTSHTTTTTPHPLSKLIDRQSLTILADGSEAPVPPSTSQEGHGRHSNVPLDITRIVHSHYMRRAMQSCKLRPGSVMTLWAGPEASYGISSEHAW